MELVARAKQVDAIEILQGEIIVGDVDRRQAGRGHVETDGTFEIQGVPAGTYRLFVNLETSTGRASGFLDANGDGAPDDVTVASGETISGIAVSVLEPLVFEEPEPSEDPTVVVDSPVSVDLDVAVGDQMLDFVQGEPGGEVTLSVYAEGVENLLGFDLLIEFDPTAVSFIEVLEDNGVEELNLLKQNGGFALDIPNPDASSLNWSVVILGATDEQLAQGDGLLGVFRFEVNKSFFGTTDITVSQLVQETSTGSSIVQPFVSAQVDGEGVTKQIIASVDAESISASGGETTISVTLADLDGITFADDDASTVTFEIVDGDATVDDASSVELTVTSGEASVVLAAQGSGTIQVAISTDGASSQLITVEAPGLGEGALGPVVLDTDTATGDQEQRILSGEFAPGDQVVVDVAALSGADGIIGFQVQLSYDPGALSFVEFTPSDLMAAGLPLPREESESIIEINVAILGGQVAGDSGSLGLATFEVLDGFAESTLIEIVSATFDEDVLSVGIGGGVVQIGGSASGGVGDTPDFDGDGKVGFSDFVQFANVFGKSFGDPEYDAKFDLNGDGNIGFPDFVTFASAFGQPAKRALTKPLGLRSDFNKEARVQVTSRPGEEANEIVVALGLVNAEQVSGYSFLVDYDASALTLLDARTVGSSLFSSEEVALQTTTDGGLLLSDIRRDVDDGASLLTLRFGIADREIATSVDVSEVFVSDGVGGITQLAGLRVEEVRVLPSEFGMSRNFPNPFNPETQISFQIPESTNLTMIVYNTLGQQVRTLKQGRISAGFHRISWDGRDEVGRGVSSGIYLVRMAAGEFRMVQKMLLLK